MMSESAPDAVGTDAERIAQLRAMVEHSPFPFPTMKVDTRTLPGLFAENDELRRQKAAALALDVGDEWAKGCPSCGSQPGRACYGNGLMPRRMTHPGRMFSVTDIRVALTADNPRNPNEKHDE
jgi:hypothetical protein